MIWFTFESSFFISFCLVSRSSSAVAHGSLDARSFASLAAAARSMRPMDRTVTISATARANTIKGGTPVDESKGVQPDATLVAKVAVLKRGQSRQQLTQQWLSALDDFSRKPIAPLVFLWFMFLLDLGGVGYIRLTNRDAQPDIVLTLSGSVTLTIPPSKYYQPYGANNGYQLLVATNTDSSGTIIGQVMMEQYYTIFDRANSGLGFSTLAGCS